MRRPELLARTALLIGHGEVHGGQLLGAVQLDLIGLAADLQLASAIRDTDLVGYITGSAYVDEIAAKPWKLDQHGMLPIPAAPGLGIELDMEAVRRYAADTPFL